MKEVLGYWRFWTNTKASRETLVMKDEVDDVGITKNKEEKQKHEKSEIKLVWKRIKVMKRKENSER